MTAYVRRILPLIVAFSAAGFSAKSADGQTTSVFTWFDPGVHGWPFSNHGFKACLFAPLRCDEPVERYLLTREWALCGGMSLSALRRFIQGTPPEGESEDLITNEVGPAQEETVRYDDVATKFAIWEAMPNNPHPFPDVALHTIGYNTDQEWPRLTSYLDQGSPVILGLVKGGPNNIPVDIGNNHQVLAIGYAEDAQQRQVFVYDPNHPYSIVTLELTRPLQWHLTQFVLPSCVFWPLMVCSPGVSRYDETHPFTITQSTGERVRGFFVIEIESGSPVIPPPNYLFPSLFILG